MEKYQRSNFIIIEGVRVFHHHTVITKNCIIYFVVQIVPAFAIVSCFSWLLNHFEIALAVCVLSTFLLSGTLWYLRSSHSFHVPVMESTIFFLWGRLVPFSRKWYLEKGFGFQACALCYLHVTAHRVSVVIDEK